MAKKRVRLEDQDDDFEEETLRKRRRSSQSHPMKNLIVAITSIVGVLGALGLALLMLLVMPGSKGARDAAARAHCVNILTRIGLAMHNYHSAYHAFPDDIRDADGKPLLSWRVALLPFCDELSLYHEFHLNEAWDSPHNRKLLNRMPTGLFCLASGSANTGETVYQGFAGPQAFFDGKATRLADIRDGASNTIAVVESTAAVPWTKPTHIPFDPQKDPLGGESFHSGGFNALFCDGSVKFVKVPMSPQLLKALITKDGGNGG